MNRVSYILALAILAISCQSNSEQDSGQTDDKALEVKSSINLPYKYHPQALMVFNQGNPTQGPEAILAAKAEIGDFTEGAELFRVKIHPEKPLFYTISRAQNDKTWQYLDLSIWDESSQPKQRILEYRMPITDRGKWDPRGLDQARANWIGLCNAHKVDSLVNNMYTEETIYFNHKPIVQGRKVLEETYAYMGKEAYNLVLQPLVVQPVQLDLIYEIGQCVGSYGGKYMLVWKREEDGKWRIAFDSNL